MALVSGRLGTGEEVGTRYESVTLHVTFVTSIEKYIGIVAEY